MTAMTKELVNELDKTVARNRPLHIQHIKISLYMSRVRRSQCW